MKSLKFLAASVMAALLMVGCAAPTTFVDSSWKNHPKSLKILFTEPDVDNLEDLKDDLPDYVDNFDEWFKNQVVQSMKQKSGNNNISFTMVKTESADGEMVSLNSESFKVPKPKEIAEDADVYLIMDKIWLGRESETNTGAGVGTFGANGGMAIGVTTSSYFRVKCKFSFYDTKTKNILGYGKATGTASYSFALTKSDWEYALNDMVKVVVDKTPIMP